MFSFLRKFMNLASILFVVSLVMVFVGGIADFPEDGKGGRDQTETGTAETGNDDLNVEADIIMETSGDVISPEEEDPDSRQEIIEEGDIEIISEDNDAETETIDENGEYKLEDYQDIDFTSSGDFRIEVNLSLQRVFVYYEDNLIRKMICSGGTEENPTPLGEYATNEKIEYSFIPRFDMGAYYWVRFYGAYLFHSVPFDKDGNMIIEEKEKLGNPASHGCIRLKLDEAKWLYDNLPLGVKVLIFYEES